MPRHIEPLDCRVRGYESRALRHQLAVRRPVAVLLRSGSRRSRVFLPWRMLSVPLSRHGDRGYCRVLCVGRPSSSTHQFGSTGPVAGIERRSNLIPSSREVRRRRTALPGAMMTSGRPAAELRGFGLWPVTRPESLAMALPCAARVNVRSVIYYRRRRSRLTDRRAGRTHRPPGSVHR